MLPPAPPPDPFLRSAMLCPRQRRAGAKAGRGSRLAHRRVGLLSQRRECPVTICTDDTVSAYRRRSTSPRARSCRGGGGGLNGTRMCGLPQACRRKPCAHHANRCSC